MKLDVYKNDGLYQVTDLKYSEKLDGFVKIILDTPPQV